MCACNDAFAIVLGEADPRLQKDSGNIAFHLLVRVRILIISVYSRCSRAN
jgi:hypothetical protein